MAVGKRWPKGEKVRQILSAPSDSFILNSHNGSCYTAWRNCCSNETHVTTRDWLARNIFANLLDYRTRGRFLEMMRKSWNESVKWYLFRKWGSLPPPHWWIGSERLTGIAAAAAFINTSLGLTTTPFALGSLNTACFCCVHELSMAEKGKMTIDHLGGVVRLREEHEKVMWNTKCLAVF